LANSDNVIAVLPLIAYWHYGSLGEAGRARFSSSFGGKTAIEAKLLIDKVRDYTNFFLVNSWDLSTNETALSEVCDYAAKADLGFVVFFDFISLDPVHGYPWHDEWILTAGEGGERSFLASTSTKNRRKQIDTGAFDEFTHGRLDVPERFRMHRATAKLQHFVQSSQKESILSSSKLTALTSSRPIMLSTGLTT